MHSQYYISHYKSKVNAFQGNIETVASGNFSHVGADSEFRYMIYKSIANEKRTPHFSSHSALRIPCVWRSYTSRRYSAITYRPRRRVRLVFEFLISSDSSALNLVQIVIIAIKMPHFARNFLRFDKRTQKTPMRRLLSDAWAF